MLVTPGGAGGTVVATPVPGCPQLEGWDLTGQPLTIDSGNHVQFRCVYSRPGQPEQATLDAFWYKPSARDVDVDYHQCGKTATGGSYYRDIWSKAYFVQIEYGVGGGSGASNAAIFQAERERLDRAVLILLTGTEKLAKSCSKTGTTGDRTRPTVRVHRVTGRAGSNIVFRFSVGDNSGKVRVVLTIYKAPGNRTVLLRKNYGVANAPLARRSYRVTIHARSVGTHLWCITATDAARNSATACSALVIS